MNIRVDVVFPPSAKLVYRYGETTAALVILSPTISSTLGVVILLLVRGHTQQKLQRHQSMVPH